MGASSSPALQVADKNGDHVRFEVTANGRVGIGELAAFIWGASADDTTSPTTHAPT